MEQRHLRGLSLVTLATAILTGCGGIGKMNKYVSTITYTVDPNPLIVQGDSVAVGINGNFPGKYFYKKALVELTPTITYTGGETPMKMSGFQGEAAAGNYTVIPYETGKAFTWYDKVAYAPSMEQSELLLKIHATQGKKELDFDPVKLADGVITTPYLMLSDDKVIWAKDAFQRITTETMPAQLNYLVASSVVRPSELSDADIKAMAKFIKDNKANAKVAFKGLAIDAYASPEGETDMNAHLADDRAASAQKWFMGEMRRNKVKADSAATFYTLNPRGEDWEGFRKAMEASSFSDKDLVLRVLTMYPDVDQREKEIKNMAATYTEIAENILPALRRSEMVLTYDLVGYSDEELATLSKTMPDSLTVEELLYAAGLATDMNEKLRIYKECERIHPGDWRASNNIGCIYYEQNKLAEAEAQFQKANATMDNPASNNNLGACARLKGDRKKAMQHYGKAAGAGPEVKYNMGIVQIQNGDYAGANSNMSGVKDFNAALAKLLGGDAAGAQGILEASPDKDTAVGHYLMAIIGARQNNGDLVRAQLAAAAAKDPSLADKARKDLEFRAFKDNLGI